jgi:hypothetical protein
MGASKSSTVHEEIIIRNIRPWAQGSSPVVSEVKDAGLYTEPDMNISLSENYNLQEGHFVAEQRSAYHRRYLARATEMCL